MDCRISEQSINNLPTESMFSTSFLDNIIMSENDINMIDQLQTNSVDDSYKNDGSCKDFEDETCKLNDFLCCSDDKSLLVNAVCEAYTSKRLTPMLKYELKCLIQARRVTQGMDEMKVQFMDPTVQQLSDAEQEQVDRRRRQNRLAARRFRQKRKMSEEILLQAIQHLQEQNQQLNMAVQVLRKEKQLLMDTVTDHLLHCPCLSQLSVEPLGGASVP